MEMFFHASQEILPATVVRILAYSNLAWQIEDCGMMLNNLLIFY